MKPLEKDPSVAERRLAKILLLYASQKGNAKDITEDVAEQCASKGLMCDLACVSEIGKTFILENTSCLVLIGSTTGDGDPPDTARKFWRQVNKKGQPPGALSHLSYTVLGLGDTNYTNFCNFGKSVDQRLQSLGASRFYPCGWADDGTGLEIVVEPWIEGLFPALTHYMMKKDQCNSIIDAGMGSELIIDSNSVCNDINKLKLSDNDNSTSNREVISSEMHIEKRSVSMEKLERGTVSDLARTSSGSDIWKMGAKYDLNIISQERIEGLSIKSCAFPVDAKLSLPVQSHAYLALRFIDECQEEEKVTNFTLPVVSAASDLIQSHLVSLRTLTSDDAVKTALEVTLQLPESSDTFDYEPGDSFGIVVKNPNEEVELLLALLGIADVADKTYELSVVENTKKRSAAVPNFIPTKGSLRYVFENCVDFRSVPKKSFIRNLIECTLDPIEQRRLKELVSKEGTSEYNTHVRESSLTLLDLLIIFQSCKPQVTTLLEHLPQLQPRAYSVTSSPLIDSKRISFVFNVVEINQKGTVTFSRNGICTGWLASFNNHYKDTEQLNDSMKDLAIKEKELTTVNIYLRSNQNFHLPKDKTTPIVMVGPGTGVAPFVGFLKHRQIMMSSCTDVSFGESWLFFGCRHKQKDYLYNEELEELTREGVLNHLIVSYSRDEESCENPKYVQDNIRTYGGDLASLIMNKGAIVYVCGDAKNMAKDVFEAFVSILELNKSILKIEARKIIAQMQIDKRYLQDVWT